MAINRAQMSKQISKGKRKKPVKKMKKKRRVSYKVSYKHYAKPRKTFEPYNKLGSTMDSYVVGGGWE